MNHALVVSESVNIQSPVQQVWKGLTDPAIIKEYLFGTDTITDWKPGSAVTFQGTYEGSVYRDKGIVQENIPGKKLSYTYWSGFSGTEDKPENYSLVTYLLEAKSSSETRFTWTQKGFANEEGFKHSMTGMADFLQKIKTTIEAAGA